MSSHCGDDCEPAPFDGRSAPYRRALVAALAINAGMFAVEVVGGVWVGSMALQADALDFAGDAATYAISLWAIGRAARTRANVAMLKGVSLAVMGVTVLALTIYRTQFAVAPEAGTMSAIGLAALAANVTSALILMRFRDGDANVRSVWLCTRNDAIGNVAVVGAALAVWATASAWPDLIVAAAMAALFLKSSSSIIARALAERSGETITGVHGHEH